MKLMKVIPTSIPEVFIIEPRIFGDGRGFFFESFKALVRARRAGKLTAAESDVFTGAVWSGRRAVEMGLADDIGDIRQTLRTRYGEKVQMPGIGARRGWLARRLRPETAGGDWAGAALAALEERALWARYGL